MNVNELLEKLDYKNEEVALIIGRINEFRFNFMSEWNAFDANKDPDMKNITKCIEEVKPFFEKYHELIIELNGFKKELTELTGIKTDESLKQLRDVWFYSKKLN